MDPYRLPNTIVPRRYDLRLEPDLPGASFTGEVTIRLTVREAVSEIVLNAADLAVTRAELLPVGAKPVAARVTMDHATERCRLSFADALRPGRASIRLCFRGELNDLLRGFYRSTYRDAAGTTKVLAATQFEATDARRAFPCWDEPAFKAVFSTTLVVDRGLVAISNTSVASETPEDGKRVIRFADTIPMSTYLVAFVVGELEATDPMVVGSTPLRVWSVPGKRRLADFGQRIAASSLAFFEAYYGRPYPGDKLDLLAIPDFAAGAMENLGAITYRETALLVDEASSTHAERERVADTVAHENAHMWFGDLVTMKWWNGLWLNEAFATFMQILAVDAWKPEWQRWTTFAVYRSEALAVDGLRSTRPVEFPVAAPRDADAMFDVLTYQKGGSVLRMLEQYLGPEVFRDGVRHYLNRHAFGNTETADLWAALGEASGQAVGAMIEPWVFQPGYPLVSAHREGGRLVLKQQRFSYLPAESVDNTVWQTPVKLRIQTGNGQTEQTHLLDQAEKMFDLPADCRAVLVNAGGNGFFRVAYAADLAEALVNEGQGMLQPIDRFNLVNDCWAAVQAGVASVSEYLQLTARFARETDRNVWTVLVASLQTLNRLVTERQRPGLQRLVRERLGPAFARLSWKAPAGEDGPTGQLRADLLRGAAILGDDRELQKQATETLDAAAQDLEPGIAGAVVSIVAHAEDANRYEAFLAQFRAATTPQEEQRYLLALAAFRDPALVARTLAGALDGTFRTQDAPLLVRTLLLGIHSRAAAWRFVQDRWNDMERLYPPNGLRRVLEGIVGLTTPEWLAELQSFVRERHLELGGKIVAQNVEQLQIVVRLRERQADTFVQLFESS